MASYSMAMTPDPPSLCTMLRQTGQRKTIANALTQVTALSCCAEGLRLRGQIAAIGGLESIEAIIVSSDDDVRLQCKAASALGSLCNSPEVARRFISDASSTAVMEKLGSMLKSPNVWAQADAVGCLGWLVGNGMTPDALHELVPVVTRLLGKHNECPPVLSKDEKKGSRTTEAVGNGKGSAGYRRERGGEAERRREVAQEQMDNLRVYTLIFLLKATNADPSTMPVMLANEALDSLLEILSTAFSDCPPRENPDPDDLATARNGGAQGEHTIDEQDPSLVLTAKLLGAFSLEPTCGAFLLEAKCVPKLLSFRKRLRQHHKISPEASAIVGQHHRHHHDDHTSGSPVERDEPPRSTNVSENVKKPLAASAKPVDSSRCAITRDSGTSACSTNIATRRKDMTVEGQSTERGGCGSGELTWDGSDRGRSGDDRGREQQYTSLQELQQPELDELITFAVEQVLSWGMTSKRSSDQRLSRAAV